MFDPHVPDRSRRRFLGGAAAAALAPFLPLSRAGAQTATPRRLVLLYSSNGTVYDAWKPEGTETSFTLGPILAPLASHQDQLLVIDGLRILDDGPGFGHPLGNAVLWTGSRILDDPLFTTCMGGPLGWGGGISVDQVVADAIGSTTPFRSLELGVQCGGPSVSTRTCYRGPNQPLAPEDNPYSLFDRLFGGAAGDPQEAERIRMKRRSVIDFVKGDLARMRARIAVDDRLKMDAHLEGIRDIERRLDGTTPGGCGPSAPAAIEHRANDSFPAVSRIQIDLLVAALACDLTRVGSLQWSRGLSPTRFTWLGIQEGHHDLSHRGDGDAAGQAQLTDINRWYAGEVAYLLDSLAGVPEGDGTLLDNTLVVWGNALAKGNNHSHFPTPFLLAGGAGGAVRAGRYLRPNDVPHNRLLVSICRAMGLEGIDAFGDMDPGTGPLAGIA